MRKAANGRRDSGIGKDAGVLGILRAIHEPDCGIQEHIRTSNRFQQPRVCKV